MLVTMLGLLEIEVLELHSLLPQAQRMKSINR